MCFSSQQSKVLLIFNYHELESRFLVYYYTVKNLAINGAKVKKYHTNEGKNEQENVKPETTWR